MMRRAVWPMAMVSGFEEKRPMRGAEAAMQMTVPAAMMTVLMPRVSW